MINDKKVVATKVKHYVECYRCRTIVAEDRLGNRHCINLMTGDVDAVCPECKETVAVRVCQRYSQVDLIRLRKELGEQWFGERVKVKEWFEHNEAIAELLNALPLLLDKYPELRQAIATDYNEGVYSHLIDMQLRILESLKGG